MLKATSSCLSKAAAEPGHRARKRPVLMRYGVWRRFPRWSFHLRRFLVGGDSALRASPPTRAANIPKVLNAPNIDTAAPQATAPSASTGTLTCAALAGGRSTCSWRRDRRSSGEPSMHAERSSESSASTRSTRMGVPPPTRTVSDCGSSLGLHDAASSFASSACCMSTPNARKMFMSTSASACFFRRPNVRRHMRLTLFRQDSLKNFPYLMRCACHSKKVCKRTKGDCEWQRCPSEPIGA
mmetsp:Transcript_103771/g.300152  ORF Transcript_103771/g.300152 Transcript_103771/m.300152 type:complete len:240 (+) Transcript_103771:525-1244(+)